jgi:hypothetical protein
MAFSQENNGAPASGGNIMDWITGGGLAAIATFILGFWKKGVGFISKATSAIIDILGGLSNILVQATEANNKIRNGLSKLEVYSADGEFTKEEMADLIKEIKEAIDEADDVPVAIKEFKETFTQVVNSFKKK